MTGPERRNEGGAGGARPASIPFGEIARAHWGPELPDWIARLVEECAFTSQSQTARRLGLSPTVINRVLRRAYPGNMGNIEDAVRGVLMHERIDCPALGLIERDDCVSWRRKARNFVPSNSTRVQMSRACNRCPHNRKGRQV